MIEYIYGYFINLKRYTLNLQSSRNFLLYIRGVFMKLVILIIYFAVLIGIGLYCRKHATDVNGFVLGGRAVGPWLTAFAYGTSYFSAVVFVGYAGQFGWKYGIAATRSEERRVRERV